MTIQHIPIHGRDDENSVPLVVYIKDGRIVNADEGGEKIVIGDAYVKGSQVEMILHDRLPGEVMDSLVGDVGVSFSFDVKDPPVADQPTLFPLKKNWYGRNRA